MKNKFAFIIVIFTSLMLNLNAQSDSSNSSKKWTFGGQTTINASQSAFSNWVAGGENSFGGTIFGNAFAKYKSERDTWDNTLDLGFGLMKQGKRPIFKTDDKIDFSSKYGRSMTKYGHWYYSALVGFKTQFYEGKSSIDDTTKNSTFMAPGYLSVSIGVDYKPFSNLSIFISPLTGRTTFVTNKELSNNGAFGVMPGHKAKFEAGGYIKVEYNQPIHKFFTYNTKLELFSNYLKNPQNIDVNWENILNFKFNNWLSANFYLTLMYDDDSKITITNDDGSTHQSARLQVREIFGIGLTYKF
ncbi:MAG: DUF3078 domain-containing protein [Bacteroidales bacterium]|jgi:hypothetical protein|nr:DUF3078 domain-containing protein [Bacteroidales bacterium]